MAHFTKEIYDNKAAWASKRMMNNAKNASLTEQQHEVLANICTTRHEIHCLSNDFHCEGSPIHSMIDTFYATTYSDDSVDITSMLADVNLPEINLYVIREEDTLCEELQTLQNWYEDKEGESYSDEQWADIYEAIAHNELVQQGIDVINFVDQQVRNYLAYIDHVYGTNYCPAGGDKSMYLEEQVNSVIAPKIHRFL